MLVNMLGFNLIWFGLVYWGNYFTPIALILMVIHLTKISTIKYEKRLVLMVTIIGSSVDSILTYLHIFEFENTHFTPIWLIVMWSCFACTLCHSLRFLVGSKIKQVLIGGLVSPLSYLAGNKIGAVNFTLSTSVTYCLLALIWAALFYLFYSLKSSLNCREL